MAEMTEINIESSGPNSGDSTSPKDDESKTSDPSTSEDSSNTPKVVESPKPMAFTIDFGERKAVDTSRFKNMFDKYQNRHRRGQSLSKIQSPKEPPSQNVQKPPLSVNFPRKTDYQSEGYFSSDQEEKSDASFLRQLKMLGLKSNVMNTFKQPSSKNELTLPLQNTTSQRMADSARRQNFDINHITSPEMDLKDISSPEFDLLTPSDPTPNMAKSMPEFNFMPNKSPGLPRIPKKESKSMFISFHTVANNETCSSPKTAHKLHKQPSDHELQNNLVPKNEPNHCPIQLTTEHVQNVITKEVYEIEDLDHHSDSVSEAGTYTLDADNYTEEQKARMSIDREFNLEMNTSTAERTQHFVESTLQYVSNNIDPPEEGLGETFVVANSSNSIVKHFRTEIQCTQTTVENTRPIATITTKAGNILSPQETVTQISVEPNNSMETHTNLVRKNVILNNIDSIRKNKKNTNKILFASKKAKNACGLDLEVDQGSFTSITTCGVFNRDQTTERNRTSNNTSGELSPEKKPSSRRSSLTQSDIFLDNNISTLNSENKQNLHLETNINDTPPGFSKKPPMSPTKIPSPIHSLSRPRSRASLDLSDSSVETDCYLKHTQNVITSLQARLSSEQSTKYDQRKIAQNILKNQTKHVRHNSFDSRNTHLMNNKLENFQTKVFQPNIDQTYASSQNQYNVQRNTLTPTVATRSPTHKLYNSPNNSPIKRSSSFSVKQMSNSYSGSSDFSYKCVNSPVASPRVPKESNLTRMSPNLNQHENSTVHRSSSTASIKKHLNPFRRNSANSPENRHVSSSESLNQHRTQTSVTVSDSSSDDEFANNLYARGKDMNNITNTRHNRAFSLRRARLDLEPPTSKCPNTPEMRRKFMPSTGTPEAAKKATVRSASIEARKADIKSRYLNLAKNAAPKMSPAPKAPVEPSMPRSAPPIVNRCSTSAKSNATGPLKNPVMARTDSGRFSMRTSKPKSNHPAPKSNSKKGNRSNSTLTSREVEFQNWKRRKSYDPMKAAAEGKRKAELNKKVTHNNGGGVMTQSYTQASQECDSSPSHSSSVHRSQSFHGTGGLDMYISSEDDLTLSADDGEGITPPAPNMGSPSKVGCQTPKQAWYQKNIRY